MNIFLPIILKSELPALTVQGVDLVVLSLAVVPSQPIAGEVAQVSVTVMNQGTQVVDFGNNFYIDVYINRLPALALPGDLAWSVQGNDFSNSKF